MLTTSAATPQARHFGTNNHRTMPVMELMKIRRQVMSISNLQPGPALVLWTFFIWCDSLLCVAAVETTVRLPLHLMTPAFFRAFGGGVIIASILAIGAHAQTYVNFEGKLTRPIVLSPDGRLLFAVNTPDARLSVFDVSNPLNPILTAEIPVGVEPVSVNARNNDEVWVVNEVSDTVSVVSVSGRKVIDTLYVKDEPADVIFANGRAFVTAARNNRLAIFDATSRVLITNLALAGENPRALAATPAGDRVYVAFALSGNRTTIVPPDQAPLPPPPTNPNLPAGPRVGLLVDATDPTWSGGANPVIRYTLPDNDVAEIDTTSLAVVRYFSHIGTVNFNLALRPGGTELYVANTDARNLTRFEPALRGTFISNRVTKILLSDGSKTDFDLNPGFSTNNFPNLSNQTNALAQPVALVFGPSGSHYYVAAYGSDRIARVDAVGGIVQVRIDLCPTALGSSADPRNKRGPRGMALKPGVALYVLNRISGTISVIELRANVIALNWPSDIPSVVRSFGDRSTISYFRPFSLANFPATVRHGVRILR